MKITTISKLGIASFAVVFAACANAGNSANTTNNSNTAVLVNSNQATASPTVAPSPAGHTEEGKLQGELQVGRTQSVILYLGQESGDYAGYCFGNDSDAGRTILAACKDRSQCAIVATIDYESRCIVPEFQGDLSATGAILRVASAKDMGPKK